MAVRRTSLAIAVTAGLAIAGVAVEATAATSPNPKATASSSTTTTTMKKKSPMAGSSAAASSTTTTTMKKK